MRQAGSERAPKFLYRPLTVEVDAEKRKLFSVAFDGFEDPVLLDLYREKQQELDLQLSMLTAAKRPDSSNSAGRFTARSNPCCWAWQEIS